jgi:hypothetical protein
MCCIVESITHFIYYNNVSKILKTSWNTGQIFWLKGKKTIRRRSIIRSIESQTKVQEKAYTTGLMSSRLASFSGFMLARLVSVTGMLSSRLVLDLNWLISSFVWLSMVTVCFFFGMYGVLSPSGLVVKPAPTLLKCAFPLLKRAWPVLKSCLAGA